MTDCEALPAERIIVAKHGRANAAVNIVPCDDGLYRFSVDMHYSHGGFSFPVCEDGFPTSEAGRRAGIETILRKMHTPFSSDPDSVKEELRQITQQLQEQRKQPAFL